MLKRRFFMRLPIFSVSAYKMTPSHRKHPRHSFKNFFLILWQQKIHGKNRLFELPRTITPMEAAMLLASAPIGIFRKKPQGSVKLRATPFALSPALEL